MFKNIALLAMSTIIGGSVAAKNIDTWCAEVPNWAKGKKVPGSAVYEKEINISNTVSKDFVRNKWSMIDKKKLSEENLWVIIDARSKSDRTQTISKTVLLTSDYKDASKHEFDEKNLAKKITKRLRKSVPKSLKEHMKFTSIADLNKKNVKMIVFCNGPTCHRSTFGVCELRRLGIKRENINIFLDGFDGLKDAGLKFK